MEAGTLRKRVILQEPREIVSEDTGVVKTIYRNIATVWANVNGVGGQEALVAGQVEARAPYTVVIRFFPGLKPLHRVRYGDLLLEVRSVDDDEERHRMLTLTCEALDV